MIRAKQFWIWRAVDSEGEVLDPLVQRRPNKAAAIKLCANCSRSNPSRQRLLVANDMSGFRST
jgi:putative transposase